MSTKDLWRLNATEIACRVAAGEITASDVIDQSLQRLQAVNPIINAVVQEMPDQARAAARKIDQAVAAGKPVGPLAGVPVTIKVNADQRGFANTNGVRIQADNMATEDSPVVTNLRNAGAIVVGRSNTPAFSLRWFTNNSLHGHTRNPRDLSLTPGGSSGGAGAAVAAGICAIGHGTDIAGSIRYPAYACGLHGLRPSFGRVAAANLSLPDRYIGGQLTAVSGPITRSIDDVQLGLAAMSAASSVDPWWVPAPLELGGYEKRAALCISPDGLVVSSEVEAALRLAANQLRDAGWSITEVGCPPMREAMDTQLLLWMSDYQLNNGAAIQQEDDPGANFAYAQLLQRSPEIDFKTLMEALQTRARLAREWQLFLANYPLLLCPVSAEAPFPDQLDVESPEAFARVIEAQMTQIGIPLMGLPALSVAMPGCGDRPMGVQLVAARFREDILLSAGREIESRNPPVQVADLV